MRKLLFVRAELLLTCRWMKGAGLGLVTHLRLSVVLGEFDYRLQLNIGMIYLGSLTRVQWC
jgi:hypothetical protein